MHGFMNVKMTSHTSSVAQWSSLHFVKYNIMFVVVVVVVAVALRPIAGHGLLILKVF
jgi:hypothetical protein